MCVFCWYWLHQMRTRFWNNLKQIQQNHSHNWQCGWNYLPKHTSLNLAPANLSIWKNIWAAWFLHMRIKLWKAITGPVGSTGLAKMRSWFRLQLLQNVLFNLNPVKGLNLETDTQRVLKINWLQLTIRSKGEREQVVKLLLWSLDLEADKQETGSQQQGNGVTCTGLLGFLFRLSDEPC